MAFNLQYVDIFILPWTQGLAIYIRNPSADMGGKLADLNLVPEVKDTILSPLEVVCSPMFRVGYSVEVHDDI